MNIRDIAKLSGVGVSTVSRVLNNHPDVKESTREKVMQIIKESNYIPNNSARILKQNNTKNIGVLIKGVFNPFFSEMLNVIGSKINESKIGLVYFAFFKLTINFSISAGRFAVNANSSFVLGD